MSDTIPNTEDAKEALQHGEKPDRGHTSDALQDALSGTDSGSDTRAGSLEGGPASGSEDDSDQDAINQSLATEGMAEAASAAAPQPSSGVDPAPVTNTGLSDQGSVKDKHGGEADAATG